MALRGQFVYVAEEGTVFLRVLKGKFPVDRRTISMSQVESQPDEEIFDCPVCGQTFFSQAVMLMHLTRVHRDEAFSESPKGRPR